MQAPSPFHWGILFFDLNKTSISGNILIIHLSDAYIMQFALAVEDSFPYKNLLAAIFPDPLTAPGTK